MKRGFFETIVALDIDGTIVDQRESFYRGAQEIFSELKKKEIEFLFVTARPFQALNWINKVIDSQPLGIITYNGAAIMLDNRQIIIASRIEPIQLVGILNKLHGKITSSIRVHSISRGILHIGKKTEWPNDHLEYYKPNEYLLFEDVEKIDDAVKVSFWEWGDERFFISDICLSYGFSIVENKPKILELCSQNVDKGSAIKTLLNKIHRNAYDLISIGDGYPDIPMFKESKISFSFKSSQQEVKSQANIILSPPDEGGLFEFLVYLRGSL
ncbi:hypothetical protein PA598K_04011 [Paenibacillus sp. 598K]|uniref:HAD-IIB family hydrolase n=1 Tax=Paenibacillus sp. 598K TaxID=1117987 RepID=UPI000FF93DB9|nr:HAD-IIB family hydrolase [Paenibacillus sp. 598K]GBF75593.1 hypothetical protein PA598K_04011 [Paenibacillus sp. 598K]